MRCSIFSCGVVALFSTTAFTVPVRSAETIRFNSDVRPILSNTCFECHGFDKNKREANLRLDTREGGLAALDSGDGHAIVPGEPDESVLLTRITSHDVDERMPPAKFGKQLSVAQIATLREWIAQGAKYERHWAFVTPVRPSSPPVKRADWSRSPIDHFVQAALEARGLAPSPEADRPTLIRRLSLDLTGLPPTPEEVDAFLTDESPIAYERLVDRLLASTRYGERMAQEWLDAARYADTMGYQADWERFQWRWRSWVIDAYNRNLPFNQFTIEQLAGDLLPNATTEQVIASGFNRNHRINDEGGVIPAEYLVEYQIDRIETTSTVWMGMTLGCARCHDHKYDPFSQREFYQLFSFFYNVPEKGKDGRKGFANPSIRVAVRGKQAEYDQLKQRLASAAKRQQAAANKSVAEFEKKHTTMVMVMQEMDTPRQAFVLKRGQYDQPGEKVSADVPAAFSSLPEGVKKDRLALARWLVDGRHPLTARVTVNRYWAMLMGTGLVRTVEDFGMQGEYPSHPELLDWLATEYVRIGWDTKALLRLIVTSATYRQASVVRADRHATDPKNRLLGRMSRLRLPAETIRDQALYAGGLLVEKIGGPSVKIYQPAGLWSEVSFQDKKRSIDFYVQDHGDKLYRRSIYTFWKRSVPPPAMVTFDAPSREMCIVSRSRTNTPLQALALMNDVTYVEAARSLAARTMGSEESDANVIIRSMFRRVMARDPDAQEQALLVAGFEKRRKLFSANPDRAARLLKVGESPAPKNLDSVELAAYATVAMNILNLDETINRE